jgi:hypothetical protein
MSCRTVSGGGSSGEVLTVASASSGAARLVPGERRGLKCASRRPGLPVHLRHPPQLRQLENWDQATSRCAQPSSNYTHLVCQVRLIDTRSPH